MKSFRVAASGRFVVPTIILCAALAACRDDPVEPRPVPGNAVAVTYCAATAPTAVAFRDGDGSWTRELPEGTGSRVTFHHVFTSERAAIATVTPEFGGVFTVTRVSYGTPEEMSAEGDTTAANCLAGGGKTLRGDVAGLETTQLAIVTVSPFARATVVPHLGLDFTVERVASGPQDLLAVRTTTGAGPSRLILRRDINQPSGSLIPTLDFESAEAFDVVTANVSIENLGGEPAVNLTGLITAHGRFSLPFTSSTTSVTQPYTALPAGKLLAGDLQNLRVSASGATPRTAEVYFRAPADRAVTLGDPIERPTISVIGSDGALRLRARFVSQPDYDKSASVVYEQLTNNTFVAVSMTAAYAAISGGYDLDVPDLSAVAGFGASRTLRPGVRTEWTAIRTGGTLPLGRNVVPVDGATQRTSWTQDLLVLP